MAHDVHVIQVEDKWFFYTMEMAFEIWTAGSHLKQNRLKMFTYWQPSFSQLVAIINIYVFIVICSWEKR